jgi:hypothetical protein
MPKATSASGRPRKYTDHFCYQLCSPEVVVDDRAEFNIIMVLEAKGLDDVVVIGYGTKRGKSYRSCFNGYR